MDFDPEEGFPGLYNSESGRRSNDSDYSDGDHEKPSKKDLLIGRRKDKKESKKDRGYAALAGESSPEEDVETKSPSKSKKTKAFKFPSKSKEKREKSRDKEKVGEKEVKEKEKENLEREKKKEKLRKEKEKREKEKEEKIKIKESKEKVKDKEKDKVKEKDKEKLKEKDKDKKERKNSKQQPTIAAGIPFEEIFTLGVAQPIFGVSLGLAVERSRCHDDTNLPLVVRDCIDYLQAHGLQSESIYRVEPPKQRVLVLRKLYNDRELVTEKDYEVPTACSLLKLFITELPEPVLTTELCSQFEEFASQPPASLSPLISQLPSSHRALLGWLIAHISSVLANEKSNRLNIQTVGTLLGPTLNMSTSLLTLLVVNSKLLFPDVNLSKYVPPLSVLTKLPDTAEELSKELRKQESLLSQIHAEMHAGFVTQKREEQLWEGQRIVTQLKRKLRSVLKSIDPSSSSQTQSSVEERHPTFDDEKQDKIPSNETVTVPPVQINSDERQQPPAPVIANVIVVNDTKPPAVVPPEKSTAVTDVKPDPLVSFPIETFEDNFESFDDMTESYTAKPKNEMTDSIYSSNSESFTAKNEKPMLSDEELGLMRLQLEHAEFLQLKSILQAKINSERFEIVKLRSHMAIKNKQENNGPQLNNINCMQPYTDTENEERVKLMKENALLEQKRLSLVYQIFQERAACIQLRIQLAMNEIL